MEAKDIIKIAFDNDIKTLDKALQNDAELYKSILLYHSKILLLLLKKEIITEKELEEVLKDEALEKQFSQMEYKIGE